MEAHLTSRVDLHFECRGLANTDVMSKSDPICVFSMGKVHAGQIHYTEVGRTEVIKNTLNPKWVKGFTIDYRFEAHQYLRMGVYDVDNETSSLEDDDFLGFYDCLLSDVVTARGCTLSANLMRPGKKDKGQIIIRCEELSELNDVIVFEIEGRKLDKKDFFGKSDPYLRISRSQEGGDYVPVFQTDFIKKTLDPNWPKFEIPIVKLCNADDYRPLLFEVFDWDKNGKHDLIGTVSASLNDIFRGEPTATKVELVLISEKKKPAGQIYITGTRYQMPSFMDYISGGCEVSLLVSVDFTGSNGDPRMPGTLHHVREGVLNQYESVIASVGDILIHYDSDKKVPAFGFGGILRETQRIDHCFSLKPMGQSPECEGIGELLHAYRWRIANVGLAGPTLFTPSIRMATGYAKGHLTQMDQHYFILLIITDGIITDMRQTIDALVEAAEFPLSIVIVGVGNEDFANMQFLDADTEPLQHSNGSRSSRDIVQFVEYSRFQAADPSLLAQEVLAEVPGQVVKFMGKHGIRPNPPPPPYIPDIPAEEEGMEGFSNVSLETPPPPPTY
eukprot:TRINITY_DN583_c0_g3_i2.p1 TRINITY_DN583_c0_g3~~TRINITY_DN583_c0_g3_i2.p1  ORF type:complete len:558 (-),score=147.73 TRINITY_DN583_c0_g3_i2:982-2655(-)